MRFSRAVGRQGAGIVGLDKLTSDVMSVEADSQRIFFGFVSGLMI